jgi:hypothetical protein
VMCMQSSRALMFFETSTWQGRRGQPPRKPCPAIDVPGISNCTSNLFVPCSCLRQGKLWPLCCTDFA